MTRTLYELSGRDDTRFSPFCWRTRFALAHKNLPADLVPVAFGEKEKISFSGQQLVPILVDDGATIADSWKIACYLEEKYSKASSLFGGFVGQAEALFINHWCDKSVHPPLVQAIILDVFKNVRPEDQPYFRETREKRFGKSLEALYAERETHLANFRKTLEPARAVIGTQSFLGGVSPSYADYILAGTMQWARLASPQEVLAADDPLRGWRSRVFGLFDGLAHKVAAAT
ncbi:MAG: glutathione S-transferase family protein [Alphaproteobacteria bacterium]|nr:glutathione S-transferase family protein [Alphaproteobacteria bacterium]